MATTYMIAEVFQSIQGEGMNAGRLAIFVRFAGCNLSCDFCDTQHQVKQHATLDGIEQFIRDAWGWPGGLMILTGGEPALQVDQEFVERFSDFELAMETNGTIPLKKGVELDWLTVSPKPNGPVCLRRANEVKYPIKAGDPLPCCLIVADHYLLSPIFNGPDIVPENVRHALDLIQSDPKWRMTIQQHKSLGLP